MLKNVEQGYAYTGNHPRDCTFFADTAIKDTHHQPPVVYNVVSHTKINRKGYYQAAAKALDLSVPCFEPEQDEQASKQVIGDKLRTELQYRYVYDDLLHWAVTL